MDSCHKRHYMLVHRRVLVIQDVFVIQKPVTFVPVNSALTSGRKGRGTVITKAPLPKKASYEYSWSTSIYK